MIVGCKYFFNYDAQSNYWIIKTKLLTALSKNKNETKEYSKFIKTKKLFLWLEFKKKDS